jgi:hypothetical protein
MTTSHRHAKNASELQAMIEADELADKEELAHSGVIKMSPIEYARHRKLQPQLVYYYIRAGHIKSEECICGRPVIDIASADAYLAEKAKRDRSRAQSVPKEEGS